MGSLGPGVPANQGHPSKASLGKGRGSTSRRGDAEAPRQGVPGTLRDCLAGRTEEKQPAPPAGMEATRAAGWPDKGGHPREGF